MKLRINRIKNLEEPEIIVNYETMDYRLQMAIEQIKALSTVIMAQKKGTAYTVNLEDIYYFESVDNRTFIYLENDVLEYEKRLYQIEDEYLETSFTRISKNCILNISYVSSVRPQFSGRLEATLKNGEKKIVSKHYLRTFKDKFTGGNV